MSLKNNINNNYDSDPTANIDFDAVGGKSEIWKNLEKLGQKHVKHPKPQEEEDMGELDYVTKFNRLNCPIVLDPKTSTFIDIALHAKLRQRLSESTIEKHLRYARFMEKHPMPVNFRNLSYENFIRHMDYREEIENATPNALKHQWKAMKMFMRAWGFDKRWPQYRVPFCPENVEILLPYPETVNKFFHYEYCSDRYENVLYQYILFTGFMLGMRPPSEICNLKNNDVHIAPNGRGSITITETKKHGRKRTIVPEKFILTSKVHKSLLNYIDHWRPKVENQYSGDTLYLQPNGKPFTVRYLGRKLREHGKKVWENFHPYTMRHWCATARMIEWNYDIYRVSNWLGHVKIQQTTKYVHIAQDYYEQDQGSWLKRALKSPQITDVRGQHDFNLKINRTPFSALLNKITHVGVHGPGRI